VHSAVYSRFALLPMNNCYNKVVRGIYNVFVSFGILYLPDFDSFSVFIHKPKECLHSLKNYHNDQN
jgi:hypothetical protein